MKVYCNLVPRASISFIKGGRHDLLISDKSPGNEIGILISRIVLGDKGGGN